MRSWRVIERHYRIVLADVSSVRIEPPIGDVRVYVNVTPTAYAERIAVHVGLGESK